MVANRSHRDIVQRHLERLERSAETGQFYQPQTAQGTVKAEPEDLSNSVPIIRVQPMEPPGEKLMANYQPTPGDANQAQQEYKNAMEVSAQLISAVSEMLGQARQKVEQTWKSDPVQNALKDGWDRHQGAKESAQEWLSNQVVELPGLKPAVDNLPILESSNNAVNIAAMAGDATRATLQQGKQTAAQLTNSAKEQIQSRDLGALKEKVQATLNSGQLEGLLKQVPVTLRVGSKNVFEGNLSEGKHLKGATPEQAGAIQSALVKPEVGQKPVKLFAQGKPVLLISEGKVLKDDLKLLPQAQQQTVDVKAETVAPENTPQTYEDKLLSHIEALTNEVKDLKASNVSLQDRMSLLEAQVSQQTTKQKGSITSVKDWAKTAFSTVKSQVKERLQTLKESISSRIQPKVENTAAIASGVVAAVKAVPGQAANEARQQFMQKVGEPAIHSFIRSQGQTEGGISSASTPNYQYKMDNKTGSIAMVAKDGRGTITPQNMTEADVREVGQIAQQQQKMDSPAEQQQQKAKLSM